MNSEGRESPLRDVNNNIDKYEWFYFSVLYAFLTWSALDFIAEDFTNRWRIDFTICVERDIFIIELKVEKTGKKALEQIKEKKYVEKYEKENKKIILLWIDFDEKEKNIWSWKNSISILKNHFIFLKINIFYYF